MTDIVLKIDALDEKRLRDYLKDRRAIKQPAQEFVARTANKLRQEIVERTPVDTGRLRSSIAVRFEDDRLTAVVGSNVHYAPHVEFGTKPHWPPLDALQPWARRHGFGPGRSGAFRVARIIAMRGTKARKMFQEGAKAAEGFISSEVHHLLEKITGRFRE